MAPVGRRMRRRQHALAAGKCRAFARRRLAQNNFHCFSGQTRVTYHGTNTDAVSNAVTWLESRSAYMRKSSFVPHTLIAQQGQPQRQQPQTRGMVMRHQQARKRS